MIRVAPIAVVGVLVAWLTVAAIASTIAILMGIGHG